MQLDCTPVQRVRRLTPPGIDVIPVLEGLAENQVPAIVIGEVAGALHGWPLVLGGDTVEVCTSEDALGGRLLVTEIPPGTAGFGDLARDVETVEPDARRWPTALCSTSSAPSVKRKQLTIATMRRRSRHG